MTRMDDMTQGPPSDGTRPPTHAPEAVQTLRQAMRRARSDDAERVGVRADMRQAQIGRLELLQEALAPLLAQIPRDVELFDVGLMPGTTPRLFIDMIGFVEMGRDARVYRLLQDTRHTRVTLAETAEIPVMVEAITDYVARRLLERDKALAAQDATEPARRAAGAPAKTAEREPQMPPKRGVARVLSVAAILFAFVIDLLGAIAFFLILVAGVWVLWNHMHGPVG